MVLDNFNKFGWTIPLKNKYAQTITDAFLQIVKTSKRKPNLLETDDGREYVNKVFNEFLNNINVKDILEILPSVLFLLKDLIEP